MAVVPGIAFAGDRAVSQVGDIDDGLQGDLGPVRDAARRRHAGANCLLQPFLRSFSDLALFFAQPGSSKSSWYLGLEHAAPPTGSADQASKLRAECKIRRNAGIDPTRPGALSEVRQKELSHDVPKAGPGDLYDVDQQQNGGGHQNDPSRRSPNPTKSILLN